MGHPVYIIVNYNEIKPLKPFLIGFARPRYSCIFFFNFINVCGKWVTTQFSPKSFRGRWIISLLLHQSFISVSGLLLISRNRFATTNKKYSFFFFPLFLFANQSVKFDLMCKTNKNRAAYIYTSEYIIYTFLV